MGGPITELACERLTVISFDFSYGRRPQVWLLTLYN